MITIQKYVRAQSLEEAWQLNQNKRNRILGGMLWLRLGKGTVNTAIDLCDLGLDQIEETAEEFSIGCMTSLRQMEQHEGLNAYTCGAFSLGKDIGVSTKEAKRYIDSYLAHYSGVDRYMERVTEQAKRDGYVETMFGRRRYLPELSSGKHMLKAFGERVARNMPIQGTAADIMKLAMIGVHKRFEEEKMLSRVVLQVHDELLIEAHESELERVKEILAYEMEHAAELSVPLDVEMQVGKNWYEAK